MHCLSTLTFQRIYLFQLNSNHKVFTGHTSKLLYTQELPKPIVKKATMFTCQMTNDQFFVHLALTDMINNAKAPDHSYTVIESNNCKCSINLLLTFGQFKDWLISMQCQSFVFSALLSIALVNYSAKISWK